jgi:hypothetical protein
VREFESEDGRPWIAEARRLQELDFKGRYQLVFRPRGGGPDVEVHADEVRWNSDHTASRTLRTMSEVELRRRLRNALGRVVHGSPDAVS